MAKNQTYGVILMDVSGAETDDDIQFLMTKRRNTYAFGDFIQGKYIGRNNEITMENLARMFNYMSLDEKKAIRTNNFTIIWYMYWHTTPEVSPAGVTDKIKYDEAKKLFMNLIAADNGMALAAMIDRSESISCLEMFEFPKGRKGCNETGRYAAERELIEETNFNKNFYAIYKEVSPYMHSFVGKDDGQRYHVSYFIGKILVSRHRAKVSMHQWRQIMEVSEVKLFTLRTIRDLFPYYTKACLYAIQQHRNVAANSIEVII